MGVERAGMECGVTADLGTGRGGGSILIETSGGGDEISSLNQRLIIEEWVTESFLFCCFDEREKETRNEMG